ncbi:MAG: hypothetical protein IID43_00635 [Planctomycetes bacterium]|nr:hypothetical protein [Planctomycetota bacterium]
MARIKNLYFIPRGAIAKVYGATLGIGSGHVNIIVEEGASTESIPRDDAVIQGEMASMFGELITRDLVDSVERTITTIGDLAAAAQPVAANLQRFFEERRIVDLEKGKTANITTVIERIDRLVEHVTAVLGDESLKEDVKGAVRDLRDASKEVKATATLWKTESQKLADNAGAAIDRTEENFDRSFAKVNDVLEGINDASRSLAGVMLAVEQGKGTAGLLARDERLYEAAVLALGRFNELIGTLQQIFGKIEQDGYFDVNIRGVSPLGNFKKRYPDGA